MLKTALNLKSVSKWLSDESLTKKAYLNALAAGFDYGARLVVGFLVNPLLVAGLGDYLYGVWQILGRLIAYISAASGRPTMALKWTIAHQQASTDYQEKRRNVGSAIAVWLLFLPILAVLGGVITWFAPAWLNTPPEFIGSVRLAAAVLVVDLIMTSLADVPQSVLQGENLGYKRMGVSTALVFAGGGLTALAIYFKTGIVGVAAADLGFGLLTGAFFLYVIRWYAPWFGIARPSLPEVRRFFGLSWWFLLWRLLNQLMLASDVVVLGILGSVEEVTMYTLTKYTPETLVNVITIVVFGVIPGLGGIIGAGKHQKAIRVRSEIMLGTWLIATVVGATTLLWNRSFVELWVGARHYAGAGPALLIMLMATQMVLIRNDANIIDATLNLYHKVLIGAVSVVVSMGLAGVLVRFFDAGITGLCVGFIAGRAILSLSYPWLIGRFLGMPLTTQLKSVPRPALVMVLLYVLAQRAGVLWTAHTWLSLVLAVGLTLLVVSLLAFYSGLTGDQRNLLLQRVRMVVQPAPAAD